MFTRVAFYEKDIYNVIKNSSFKIDYTDTTGNSKKYGILVTKNSIEYRMMISQNQSQNQRNVSEYFNIVLTIEGKDDSVCKNICDAFEKELPFDFRKAPDYVKKVTTSLYDYFKKMKL